MAAFDAVVDSLHNSGQKHEGAYTAKGDSPGIPAGDYHLDQHIDDRQSFARSVADDGGLTHLESVNPQAPTVQATMLASVQDGGGRGVVLPMKPRPVVLQRGSTAKAGEGALMNAADVGLGLRPIMIQRQGDKDQMGNYVDLEASKPQLFISDGTARGGRAIDAAGAVTAAEARAVAAGIVPDPAPGIGAARAPTAPPTPTAPIRIEEPAVPAKPKQRVVFIPHGGGKIRAAVDDVIFGAGILLLVYAADSDTTYEPPKATSEAPLGIQVGTTLLSCLYSPEWSAEQDGKLYLVFPIIDRTTTGGAG